MTADRRNVFLTSTGPDGVVIEVEVFAPGGIYPDALRARLDVAVRHVVEVFATGVPIDVALGDVWHAERVASLAVVPLVDACPEVAEVSRAEFGTVQALEG